MDNRRGAIGGLVFAEGLALGLIDSVSDAYSSSGARATPNFRGKE